MKRRSAGLLLLALAAGCASTPAWQALPHDLPYQRTPDPILHPKPKRRSPSTWWDLLSQSTLRPFSELISPGYWLEEAIGHPEARDVNNFGQVVDSSWFSNRIGRRALDDDELMGRAPYCRSPEVGVLRIVSGKFEGATPGLLVRDANGDSFLVKFDPAAFPQLSSNAEMIAGRILYAAGYHVPEDRVQELDLSRLVLDPQAKKADAHGEPVPFEPADLEALIAHVNPYPNNATRALFSRIIPGQVLGPFSYRGVRPDDPNDLIPHEQRRSLRGLWMFSAWLNNTEPFAANTLDTFIEHEGTPELGSVVHYLIDFSDALGAASTRPKYPGEGYENILDWPKVGAGLFSFGAYYPYWLPVLRSPYRSVGIFEADVFSPTDWRPNFPNPAFDQSGPLDDYWAASVIARFTPDVLYRIVDAAGYSEPGAREWVLRVLSVRQYQLLEHGFSRVLPLDDVRVQAGSQLVLRDLAVETNLVEAEAVAYHWWLISGDASGTVLAEGHSDRPELDLAPSLSAVPSPTPFLTVRWRRSIAGGPEGPAVHVHLRRLEQALLPVGLERQVD